MSTIDGWVLPNRAKFMGWISKTFQPSVKSSTAKAAGLFPHQAFVRDYMQDASPYRGLLLYHGLGAGKTCAAITASTRLFEDTNGQRNTVVLLPASLKQNFVDELKKCGPIWFRVHQPWTFKKAATAEEVEKITAPYKPIPSKLLKQRGGVWVPSSTAGMPFEELSETAQQEVRVQIDTMIDLHYTFFSYNGGISMKEARRLETQSQNPFDNKTVIIDEVHNFVSRVIHGKILMRVYRLLMEAKNAKLILLSGTPIINQPQELSWIINLASGYVPVYKIKYLKRSKMDHDAVMAFLNDHPFVDDAVLMDNDNTITLAFTPDFFVFTNKKKAELARVSGQQPLTHDERFKSIAEELTEKYNVAISKNSSEKAEYQYRLPIEPKEFSHMFIDFDTRKVTNPNMLARRMLGAVSYFHLFPEDVYPTMLEPKLERVKMSPTQFSKYAQMRSKEMEMEEKSKERKRRFSSMRNKASEDADGGKNPFKNTDGVYRTFSRALCNFAFPDAIPRVFPLTLRANARELARAEDEDEESDEEDEGARVAQDINREYARQKADAKAKLAQDPSYLTDQLKELSPKMAKMLENIQSSPGSCLVYSQFREVEGLDIFAMVLEANGYAELKVRATGTGSWELDLAQKDYSKPKYIRFTSDRKATKVLMDIFNWNVKDLPPNIVQVLPKLHSPVAVPDAGKRKENLYGSIAKVMMITQSGAEGISLKNVRQVHLMEPYWNDVRIKQVIGRAVRAHSHVGLPKVDRTVQVFTYHSIFRESQLKNNFMLRTVDAKQTSDEFVADLAERKKQIVAGIADIMRAAAVDCRLNAEGSCFEVPRNWHETKRISPASLAREELDAEQALHTETRESKAQLTELKIKGKRCYIDKKNGKAIYDADEIERFKRYVQIGHMEVHVNPETGKKVLKPVFD